MHALLATAVAAAAPWSAPVTLSAAHDSIDRPGVIFTGNGTTLASWSWQDGRDASARTGADSVVRGPFDGTFHTPRVVTPSQRARRGTELVGTAAIGRRGALLAQVRHVRANPLLRDADRLQVATARASSGFGRRVTIATGPQMLRVTLAGNGRGGAAIAWWERTTGHSHLRVAVRRPGEGFGAPQLLAGTGFGDVAVAVAPDGDVLVAWESRGRIRARTRVAGGESFRPADTVAAGAPKADVEAGVTASGRAAVAWAAQRATEGGERGPVTYAAAVRRAGRMRFGAEQLLERQAASHVAAPLRLVLEPEGRATVAWAGLPGVRISSTGAGPRFGDARTVSPAGAAPSDLVAGARGRRPVVWVDAANHVGASYAPAGETFGAAEAISAGPEAREARAAFDPHWRRPTVVWSERRSGSARSVARASTRRSAR
jgi:hypothetical protein